MVIYRYQESRKSYDAEMSHYKPQKKKKDPNAPKQPLSAYFIFSTEERLKVKEENPNYSICDVAKELGKRWAEMDPALKQRYRYFFFVLYCTVITGLIVVEQNKLILASASVAEPVHF